MRKVYIIMIRVDGGAFHQYTYDGGYYNTLKEAQKAMQNHRAYNTGRLFIVETYI